MSNCTSNRLVAFLLSRSAESSSIRYGRANSARALNGRCPPIERSGKGDRAEVESTLETVTACARKLRIGLALGTCFEEATDGRRYNQVHLYDEKLSSVFTSVTVI